MLQSYREQIHEKLKCVAQPYKMEVLTKLGGFYVGGIENCDFSIGS